MSNYLNGLSAILNIEATNVNANFSVCISIMSRCLGSHRLYLPCIVRQANGVRCLSDPHSSLEDLHRIKQSAPHSYNITIDEMENKSLGVDKEI